MKTLSSIWPGTIAGILLLIVLACLQARGGSFEQCINGMLSTNSTYTFSVPLTNRARCDYVIKAAKTNGFSISTLRTNGFVRISVRK